MHVCVYVCMYAYVCACVHMCVHVYYQIDLLVSIDYHIRSPITLADFHLPKWTIFPSAKVMRWLQGL